MEETTAYPEIRQFVRKKWDAANFLLFLIWPLASLYSAINNYRSASAKNLVWLFCIFVGYAFVLDPGSGNDSWGISRRLIDMHDNNMNFTQLWSSFYNPDEGGSIDIVHSLISFIISRFTDDPRILFAAFGFFFGYFYTRNIWYLINNTNIKLSRFSTLLLFAFAMAVAPWDINNVRFYTAVQVFIFGFLPYLLGGDKRKLWAIAFAVLIHWSFFIVAGVFAIYLLFRNRVNIYFILFVISFLISLLNIDYIRTLFDNYAPSFVKETRSSYLNENYREYIIDSYKTARWYLKGHVEILRWFIFICFSFFYFLKRNTLKMDKPFYNLFNLTMLFYIMVNLFNVVPMMDRFYTIANMSGLMVILLYYQNYRTVLPSWLIMAGVPVAIIFMVVRLRIGFDFIGMQMLIGNPLTATFLSNETPLIEYVKMIF